MRIKMLLLILFFVIMTGTQPSKVVSAMQSKGDSPTSAVQKNAHFALEEDPYTHDKIYLVPENIYDPKMLVPYPDGENVDPEMLVPPAGSRLPESVPERTTPLP